MRTPAILHHPRVRDLRRRIAIVRQTGRVRPDHIRLATSGATIYVDTADVRGWEIVHGLGRGHQPALMALWVRAIEQVRPTTAIDVGTNYGELLLSGRYPEGCSAHAFEANPRLVPQLRRSIAEHPDATRISLHDVLAGSADGGTAVLAVDPAWSGTAATSLDRTRHADELIRVPVGVRSVDAVLLPGSTPGPLVVKIDTEGSEPSVLAGMTETLHAATSVVLITEFDTTMIDRSGYDPGDLFAALQDIGACWSIDWAGTTTPITTMPTEATDLLVLSDPALAPLLGVG